mmetsp:Transcript_110214/g.213375  ORF Transcript_110214/g.213375 Transcript_110214/m.213375 type:complete len:232 (-) Transcript_110214:152-847(-)
MPSDCDDVAAVTATASLIAVRSALLQALTPLGNAAKTSPVTIIRFCLLERECASLLSSVVPTTFCRGVVPAKGRSSDIADAAGACSVASCLVFAAAAGSTNGVCRMPGFLGLACALGGAAWLFCNDHQQTLAMKTAKATTQIQDRRQHAKIFHVAASEFDSETTLLPPAVLVRLLLLLLLLSLLLRCRPGLSSGLVSSESSLPSETVPLWLRPLPFEEPSLEASAMGCLAD